MSNTHKSKSELQNNSKASFPLLEWVTSKCCSRLSAVKKARVSSSSTYNAAM